MTKPTIVIADLTAGAGRCAKIWPAARKALDAHFPGHDRWIAGPDQSIGDLTEKAARAGAGLIIIAGDTGTANEAADALLAKGLAGENGPVLGFVPAGAGSDLAHSLRLTGSTETIVGLLSTGEDRMLDAGRLQFAGPDGRQKSRHVFNIANLGVSAVIARRSEQSVLNRFASIHMVFFLEALLALVRFRYPQVRISADGQEPFECAIAEIVVANGRIYGGGMAIAPDADMEDGMLDVVVITGVSKLQLLDQMDKIYNGAHRTSPYVKMLRAKGLTIETLAGRGKTAELVIDGVPCGQTPVRADILPRALKVRCGAAAPSVIRT